MQYEKILVLMHWTTQQLKVQDQQTFAVQSQVQNGRWLDLEVARQGREKSSDGGNDGNVEEEDVEGGGDGDGGVD